MGMTIEEEKIFKALIENPNNPDVKEYFKNNNIDQGMLYDFLNNHYDDIKINIKKVKSIEDDIDAQIKEANLLLCTKDPLSPNMNHVHYNASLDEFCATDCMILAVWPAKNYRGASKNVYYGLDKKKEIQTYETGKLGSFPDYRVIIPSKFNSSFSVDSSAYYKIDALVKICKAAKIKYPHINFGNSVFDTPKFHQMLTFLRKLKYADEYVFEQPTKYTAAVTLDLDPIIGLVMPIGPLVLEEEFRYYSVQIKSNIL
jgi:hypothetical protein